MVSQIQMRLH